MVSGYSVITLVERLKSNGGLRIASHESVYHDHGRSVWDDFDQVSIHSIQIILSAATWLDSAPERTDAIRPLWSSAQKLGPICNRP